MPSPSQGYNVFFDILQEIQDEGLALPFQDTLNFIGDGVTAVDDPGNGRTNVNIPLNVLPHDFLSTDHPDTVPASPIRGDIVFGNATPAWERLPKGNPGEFLKVNANDVLWDQIDRSDIIDFTSGLLDVTAHTDTVTNPPTEGSLILGNATPAWERLLIGTIGQVLTSDGTTASWQTPSASAFYQTIQDEGIALPQQPTFNFIGAIVTAVDDPGNNRTNVTIAGGGANTFILGMANDGALGNGGDEFNSFFSPTTDGSEDQATGFLAFAITVKRVTVHVGTNSSDGITDVAMRDDSVDVPNTEINVPSSTTGSFDSGAISEAVASFSLINLRFLRNGDTTFGDYSVFVEVEK